MPPSLMYPWLSWSFACLCCVMVASKKSQNRYPDWPRVKADLQYIAFAGDQVNYNESAPHMRWTGHFALRYSDRDNLFIGFTPDTSGNGDDEPFKEGDMGALVNKLLEGESFPGKVTDDRAEFEDAAQSPYGRIFVIWDLAKSGSCQTPDCGLETVLGDMSRGGQTLGKQYGFPPEAPRKYHGKDSSECDGSWGHTCFNCATYPASMGLPIAEESGMFPAYLVAMAQKPNAFCRCYKDGVWLAGAKGCYNDRDMELFNVCTFEEPWDEEDEL
eukprot:TRINITY_DN79254_c0_g1_i1.p1 TRINITY_DN79254_c0_g1~~TRINITY_DN79254_c0_g1_i1.p1  ORF type:complete len:272 (+),score=37.39 TRINITY_DN79254_c0_g1_i1:43-858(+)